MLVAHVLRCLLPVASNLVAYVNAEHLAVLVGVVALGIEADHMVKLKACGIGNQLAAHGAMRVGLPHPKPALL